MFKAVLNALKSLGLQPLWQTLKPKGQAFGLMVCLGVVVGYPALWTKVAGSGQQPPLNPQLRGSNDDERIALAQIQMYRELLEVSERTNAEFSRTRDCFASSTLALDGFKQMIANVEYQGLLLKDFRAEKVNQEILQQLGQVALEANYPRGDAGRLKFCGKDERLQLLAAQFAKHCGMWQLALRGTAR
jgi:hypothetical protein